MDVLLNQVAVGILGAFMGAFIIGVFFLKERERCAKALAIIEEREDAEVKLQERNTKLEASLEKLRKDYGDLEKLKLTIDTKEAALQKQIVDAEKIQKDKENTARETFKNMAQEILNEKVKTLGDNSHNLLKGVIDPLKTDISNFHKNIESKYESFLGKRISLAKEMRELVDMGGQLKSTSDSLIKALRTDSKAQGKWGELVLERVLEISGLRREHEFKTQQSYDTEEGFRVTPDATLNLTDGKVLFIDAKVSLTYYERYIRAENPLDQNDALQGLCEAFCKRIEELSDKEYAKVPSVDTLDFVILFAPIESALAAAAQVFSENQKQSLFEYAWGKGVIITTPLTLMPILKTIDLCWKKEYENKNSLEIASQASRLYSKFVGFVERLEKVGEAIGSSQDAFTDAMRALKFEKGNLIRRTENIRRLLKQPSKLKPEYLTELNDGEDIVEEFQEVEQTIEPIDQGETICE